MGGEGKTREDFREIARLVRPGSRVLDVGCGEGELLELLAHEKNVEGRGLEISPEGVSACMARGLAVVQGDADDDLDYFPARGWSLLSEESHHHAHMKGLALPREVLEKIYATNATRIYGTPR